MQSFFRGIRRSLQRKICQSTLFALSGLFTEPPTLSILFSINFLFSLLITLVFISTYYYKIPEPLLLTLVSLSLSTYYFKISKSLPNNLTCIVNSLKALDESTKQLEIRRYSKLEYNLVSTLPAESQTKNNSVHTHYYESNWDTKEFEKGEGRKISDYSF